MAAPEAPSGPSTRRKARDVYGYFDNDVKAHAPYDAAELTRQLGLPSPLPPRDTARTPPAEAQVRGGMPALARRLRA